MKFFAITKVCNHCGHIFDVDVMDREDADKHRAVGFACPSCGKRQDTMPEETIEDRLDRIRSKAFMVNPKTVNRVNLGLISFHVN